MSFTPFQRLVAQVTLEAIADLGFALGGGQALHAHGYGGRLSLDLDIHALLAQTGWTAARLFGALRDNLRPFITVDEFAADLAVAGDQDPEDYRADGLSEPTSLASRPISPPGPPNCALPGSSSPPPSERRYRPPSRISVDIDGVTLTVEPRGLAHQVGYLEE